MRYVVIAAAGGAAFLALLACKQEGQANPAAPTAAVLAPAASAAPSPGGVAAQVAPTAPAGDPAAVPAGEKTYTAETSAVTLKVGASADTKLTIRAAKGLHFNQEYPAKFVVTAAAYAKCTKDKLAAKTGEVKFEGNDGVVTIPLQGLAVGTGKLEVVGSFSVCSDEQCYILRDEKLAIDVAVQ